MPEKHDTKDQRRVTCCGGVTSEYLYVGEGTPLVVLESGLGDDLQGWNPLLNRLQDVTSVFAYNRAGYGKSASNESTRDGSTIASELHTVLHALNCGPPYLLVGHSLGGAYCEMFAHLFPEEVCGLVLLDAMSLEMDQICKESQIAEWESSWLKRVLSAVFLRKGTKRELRSRTKTLEQAQTRDGSVLHFPVLVISAGKGMWTAGLQDAWMEAQSRLLQRYPSCSQLIVADSGHYIQTDDPRCIAGEIIQRWFPESCP